MSQPGILLMAAGHSRRYQARCGRHKLLETLPGTTHTLFEQALTVACATGLAVHAVLRPEVAQLAPVMDKQGVHYSMLASGGLGESIAAGVMATAHWPGWLILLADMPWLHPETLLTVSAALAQSPTARPCWQGQQGHPVGFSAVCREALLALGGDAGAKALLSRWPARLITVQDRGCIDDIDTPEQLRLQQHGSRYASDGSLRT